MYKALIIDDERPARQAIFALGKWEKYNVAPPMEASNCIAALAIIEEIHTDIVFLDISLPVMDGIEFIKRVAPNNPSIKFIVISGYDKFEYARQSIRYGVVDYLLKPVVEEELERALERVVALLDVETGQKRLSETGILGTEQARGSDDENWPSKEKVIAEIIDYIEANYAREINLNMFSQRYHLTKEYLSRCFKEVVGFGIYEFVTETRMKKAKKLLMDPQAKIRVVAEQVGYNDQNYFSRAFKKYTGVHPSEFKSGRKDEDAL